MREFSNSLVFPQVAREGDSGASYRPVHNTYNVTIGLGIIIIIVVHGLN